MNSSLRFLRQSIYDSYLLRFFICKIVSFRQEYSSHNPVKNKILVDTRRNILIYKALIAFAIDFHDIWWLLKEPLDLAGNPQSEFTCCWCTSSQLWFLRSQRV